MFSFWAQFHVSLAESPLDPPHPSHSLLLLFSFVALQTIVLSIRFILLHVCLSVNIICLPMQKTQEIRVQSLKQEEALKKEMATESSILAWKISGVTWQVTVHGVTKHISYLLPFLG